LSEVETPSKVETPWPPHVGDHVQIVATGAPGVVMDVNESRHFVVAIYSPELRAVTTAPYRTFMLRQIGPVSAPAAVNAPPLAAPRRGARQKLLAK
jgi:hypothetical protein